MVLGSMLFFSTLRFIYLGWIEDHYIQPLLHFSYYGFEWLPRVSATGLYLIHGLMLMSSLFVFLGLFYRISAILLFVTFTYTELYDLTYYLNHYYFVSLACLFLIVVPANVSFSWDVLRKAVPAQTQVPAWTIRIFMLQLGIVYLYAGMAKINYDWLIDALPLRIWLPPNNHLPLIGEIFNWKFTPWVFSWFGMLYDLTIPFWLMWKPSRPLAYLTVILFHIMTGILFQIGVFPLVMIGATLIFFSEEWHIKWQNLSTRLIHTELNPTHSSDTISESGWMKTFITAVFCIYFLFQIVFPWRFILYPGKLFWTEEGYRFGWRVMLMEKAATATFYVQDICSGKEGEVHNPDFLNPHQEKQMAMQPDMILQYAAFLKSYYAEKGMCAPKVRAEIYATLNGTPGQLLIDPQLDLASLKDSWAPKEWILPFNTSAAYHVQN